MASSHERNPRGGSDLWDNGLAGEILRADYFTPPTTLAGKVKVWTGSVWAVCKAWTGTQWVALKAWTGTQWV